MSVHVYPIHIVMTRSACYDPVILPRLAFWRKDHAQDYADRMQALEEYDYPLWYVETCDVEPDHG